MCLFPNPLVSMHYHSRVLETPKRNDKDRNKLVSLFIGYYLFFKRCGMIMKKRKNGEKHTKLYVAKNKKQLTLLMRFWFQNNTHLQKLIHLKILHTLYNKIEDPHYFCLYSINCCYFSLHFRFYFITKELLSIASSLHAHNSFIVLETKVCFSFHHHHFML